MLNDLWINGRVLLNQVVRSSGGYFVTTLINQSLPFLLLPVFTHFWSPEEYGAFAIFSLYMMFLNTLSGTSIPQVISKHFFSSEKEEIAGLIGNSIIISALLTVTVILLILIGFPFFGHLVDIPLIWLLAIPFGSFAFVTFNIGLNVMKNNRQVWVFGRHQIGNTIINFATTLALVVLLLWGWEGRAVGILLSFIISAFLVLFYLNRHDYLSFRICKKHMREVMRVALPMIPNSVQAVVISQSGLFFIDFYFTKELTGIYALGFQIAFVVKLLILTIALSWSPYVYEQISGRVQLDKKDLARRIVALWGTLLVGVLFVNLVSEYVLHLMTAPEYYGAEEFIFPLSIGFMFYGMYVFIMPILIRNNQQRYISLTSFMNMVLLVALSVWLIDVYGYIGVTYAFALTYFAMFVLLFWRADKVLPLPWKKAFMFWK